MRAYGALDSLRRKLRETLDFPQQQFINHNGAALQQIDAQINFLLGFFRDSSAYNASQISALERKTIDAAYKAENFIQSGSLQPSVTTSISPDTLKISLCLILYIVIILSLMRLGEARSSMILGHLSELVLCTILAVALYLHFKAYYLILASNGSQELQGILYDFNIIVHDAVRIQRAARDPHHLDLSAQAALRLLRWNLDLFLRFGLHEAHCTSLRGKLNFLLGFLENASSYMITNELELQNLDTAIRIAAYKAEKTLMELKLHLRFNSDFLSSTLTFSSLPYTRAFCISATRILLYPPIYAASLQGEPEYLVILVQIYTTLMLYMLSAVTARAVLAHRCKSETKGLPLIVDEFSNIVRTIEDVRRNPNDLPAASSSRQDLGGTSRNVVVGLDSDLKEIMTCLTQYSEKRELTAIVGMGGIGKTTLARQVYNDPSISDHFDIRAWVTVSQEYSRRHVLLCLLESAGMLKQELMQEDNEDKLATHLHKILTSRRYLIVMDDVWDTEIWDFMSAYFPDNQNRSRVLLTSRLSNVASYPDSNSLLHQMQCLNEDKSWDLLHEKVFGAQTCPPELVSIGREVAGSCRGLPLAIVVIGGLLYNDNRIETWRDIVKSLQDCDQYLEILGLSYNHLPYYLRPCFLYMGAFQRDREIPVSTLISLWVAEGFLNPGISENMEELGVNYLKDLIHRNLVSVCKESCNGKIRTCSIHDRLRDVCVQKAREEKFLYVVESGGPPQRTPVGFRHATLFSYWENPSTLFQILETTLRYLFSFWKRSAISRESPDDTPHRLSIHRDVLQGNASRDLKCFKHARSFLCIGSNSIRDLSVVYLRFLYLQVLDILVVHFAMFPDQITKLSNLRYLAVHSDGPLPSSISNLRHLQTLVYHHSSFSNDLFLPLVIWTMINLRHIYIKPGCHLSNPLDHGLPSFVLEHLQTLVGIRNFKWTEGIIRIPNLKKLGISYDVPSSVDWSSYQLESLVDLHRLESLKIIIKYDDEGSAIPRNPPNLAFPKTLKTLSLSGCGMPWASMTTIGALPDLEALKLRCEAFSGDSWETVEGEFPQLIFLQLEDMSLRRWETEEADHFPRLQHIVVRSCGMLEGIPPAVGEIPTLELIHLVDCLPSAVDSAKQIQEEQKGYGNEDLKVHIERRGVREGDEMNLGDMDARGVGAGVFPRWVQGRIIAVRSLGDEVMKAMAAVAVGLVAAIVLLGLTIYQHGRG